MNKFIGPKKIKETTILEEKTPGNIDLIEVEFEDSTKEVFSKVMLEAIRSEEACDLSQLREKRVNPIVGTILAVLREWGIKTSELAYMSALLNQSLEENEKVALKNLWKVYIPNINSLDDVNLIAIDRVLKQNEKPIPSPFSA